MKVADTVYVRGHGTSVGVEKGALTVKPVEGERTRVPLTGVERVVLLGRARVSDQAMQRCTSRGIRIASLSRTGRLRYAIGPPTSGNVHLRVAQVRLHDDPRASLLIAQSIVAGKIFNSRAMIRRWRWDSNGLLQERLAAMEGQLGDRLQRVAMCPALDEVRGVEGDSARLYFKGLGAVLDEATTDFRFDSRSRRPPRTPTNALLSYCYGLLVNEACGAAAVVGLDDQIGFLHRLRPGRPSLALDLVEELRSPFADRFVVSAVRRRQVRLEHLRELPGGAWRLTDEGRDNLLGLWEQFRLVEENHQFLDRAVERWAIPHAQATLMARHLRGDLDAYPPWVRAA